MPEGTARVSVVARDLSFLTEILEAGFADAEKDQNARVETKNAGRRSRTSGVNFLAFLPQNKLRLPYPNALCNEYLQIGSHKYFASNSLS